MPSVGVVRHGGFVVTAMKAQLACWRGACAAEHALGAQIHHPVAARIASERSAQQQAEVEGAAPTAPVVEGEARHHPKASQVYEA